MRMNLFAHRDALPLTRHLVFTSGQPSALAFLHSECCFCVTASGKQVLQCNGRKYFAASA
ncbi:hypothetical protein BN439_3095 [Erwinia amylovora Ea644]|nr:hypothetical protein BN439_3095 [Erwinia amylovora Ea644]CCP08197.1 hypothetical protein BN440_3192 [Erwinia amylovora MR1]